VILVTFAVPFESAAFRREAVSRGVRILHTGVGADAARAALEQALCEGVPERVIASGFAGALVPELAIGEVVTERSRRIASAAEVLATAEDKRAFRERTGAEVVDMETEAIREVCEAAGVPLSIRRVISDRAEDDLGLPPVLLDALSARPVSAMPRLLWTLATQPARRRAFLRLVRDCRTAQRALAATLVEELGG
jgi:adenosylhomocysteine nucleosidase